MMKCQEVREALPLWVGQDLDPEQMRAVQDHLKSCAGCRAAADSWVLDHRRLVDMVGADQGPQLGLGQLKVMADSATTGDLKKPARSLPLWQFAGPMAAVLALVIIWLGISPTQPDPEISTGPETVSWAQLQEMFDGCLGEPVTPEEWPGESGPGVVAVLTPDEGRFVVADCLEAADLARLAHYPWLQQRLDSYRKQFPDRKDLLVAVCPTGGADRGTRRTLQRAVLARFTGGS